jgi:hypothetical protein
MRARTVIKVDGDTYFTKFYEVTQEELGQHAETICRLAKSPEYFKADLENGDVLILPTDAARRSVWRIEISSE